MSVATAGTVTVAPGALLFHSSGYDPGTLRAAVLGDGIAIHRAQTFADVGWVGDTPAVLLVDPALLAAVRDLATELAILPESVVLVASDTAVADRLSIGRVVLALTGVDQKADLRVLRSAYQLSATKIAADRSHRELERTRTELAELHRIGVTLMTERDPDALLVSILDQAKRLTNSDAGSLYLVEKDEDGTARLRFKLSQNDSLQNLPFAEFTLPINEGSLAGYAAVTRTSLVLDDAYLVPDDAPYSFARSFDQRFGYRTKSMLVVPMVDHRDEVVGVVQLLNSKSDPLAVITSEQAAEEYVLPYGEHELKLVQSLAGQAAISIENARQHAQVQLLFESFVKAAVTAIDQRDPTTAGHSIRVAAMTVDIAQALERVATGKYAGTRFSRDQLRELRYAALLHDFGKVGVREEVLVKAKKLPPYLHERVEARFDLIRRTVEADYLRRRADVIRAGGSAAMLRELELAFARERAELAHFQDAVRAANEPNLLPEEAAGVLGEIALRRFRTPAGDDAPFLTSEELHFLSIPKGSLDDHERLEIESHVEQTYRFLSQVPWTEDLRNLPAIAYGHHEKLNGRGYPRGVRGEAIPVQTRIMTIADIFDALTASDRPYKPAVPAERALSILEAEAGQGLLDPELVRIVIEGRIYQRVLEQDWRKL